MALQRPNSHLLRDIPGRKVPLPISMFGSFGLQPLQLLHTKYANTKSSFATIGDLFDFQIQLLFEKSREGLSVDAFLSSPARSKKFSILCRKHDVDASEFAINMRLFAIRKKTGGGGFSATSVITRADHLIAEYGPGVESGMLQILTKFGSSIDHMIAHPVIGKEFVTHARLISPGGKAEDYRLCALQIRKSRHISSTYEESTSNHLASELDHRWENLGTPQNAQGASIPNIPGIVELVANDQPLFLLRHKHIGGAIEKSFQPKVIKQLIDHDWFTGLDIGETTLRLVTNKTLPSLTPKIWELILLRDHEPVFNWPLKFHAA